MLKISKLFSSINIFILIFLGACASNNFQHRYVSYQKNNGSLHAKFERNSHDKESLANLVVDLLKRGETGLAQNYIQSDSDLMKDPRVVFYMGMTLELSNEFHEALNVYKRYRLLSHASPYRQLLRGRYNRLSRKIIHEELRANLNKEERLDNHPGQNVVAVLPLIYSGMPNKYGPLGTGLSEMIRIDLAKVQSIKVIERIRLWELLDKLKSKVFDQNNNARLGKLLRAGVIVSGVYNVVDDTRIQMEVASVDLINSNFSSTIVQEDLLANLYYLEKDFVFRLIDEMGIQLTSKEWREIQQIPTRNLDAFLTYSLGLEEENRRAFKNAVDYFRKALELDPNFNQAADKLEEMESLAFVGESLSDALKRAAEIENRFRKTIKIKTTTSTRLLLLKRCEVMF